MITGSNMFSSVTVSRIKSPFQTLGKTRKKLIVTFKVMSFGE